jgi:hypothetical protein
MPLDSMNFKSVDITNWIKLNDSVKGSRDKEWVTEPFSIENDISKDIELFLFKESHYRHPVEFWSEVITHHIGQLVGVTTPETFCAKMEDKYGALIRFFLKVKKNEVIEELDHGTDLILAQHPDFDPVKGETHNIRFVEEVFQAKGRMDLFSEFLKILVFDTLIGNTDRHQDNWGFILDDNNIVRLTPAFDNSDSLGREIVENKIDGFLEEDGAKLKKYILSGKPHIRWSIDGKSLSWLNHFDFLEKVSHQWPDVLEYVKLQTKFKEQEVDNILKQLALIRIDNPLYVLSQNRIKFIKRIILFRRDILIERFGC